MNLSYSVLFEMSINTVRFGLCVGDKSLYKSIKTIFTFDRGWTVILMTFSSSLITLRVGKRALSEQDHVMTLLTVSS